MFKNYEIQKIKNEEVLIIYIDMNTEFAKLNFKNKTTINKEINNYIKDNKIKFNGKKIILMAGSLLIGTLLYTSPILKPAETPINYQYKTNIVSLNESINLDQKENTIESSKVEEVKSAKEENKQTTKENTVKTSPKENNSSTSSKKISTNNTKPNISNQTPSTSNTNTPKTPASPTIPQNETSSKEEAKKPIENKQMVTIKRSNGTTVTLELEEYIIGVVSAEMPASFHTEALKAQAVAARTYALKAIKEGKTLTDTVSTQVYQDNKELQAKWGSSYNTYYNKIKNAVLSTEGLIMIYKGSIINAYYHSTSNGYTEDSTAVFGAYPYLKSVASPVDTKVSSYLKTIAMSYENISNKLGIPVTNLSTISITKNNSNRVDKIIIDNNVYGGVEFRTKLGLRSTDFDINLNENNISITTRGYGHGVGMSQYGAHEYAKTGMTYQNILKHYYTGINITKYQI